MLTLEDVIKRRDEIAVLYQQSYGDLAQEYRGYIIALDWVIREMSCV